MDELKEKVIRCDLDAVDEAVAILTAKPENSKNIYIRQFLHMLDDEHEKYMAQLMRLYEYTDDGTASYEAMR